MITVSPGTDEAVADPAPEALDAEGVVLSWALDNGPVAGLLTMHFYSDANRHVYAAVLALAERSEPLDVVAVARELQTHDRLRQVGGKAYLAMLLDCQPATANVQNHAGAIREMYRRRVLSDAALRLRVELRNGACAANDGWARFKAICEELTNA